MWFAAFLALHFYGIDLNMVRPDVDIHANRVTPYTYQEQC